MAGTILPIAMGPISGCSIATEAAQRITSNEFKAISVAVEILASPQWISSFLPVQEAQHRPLRPFFHRLQWQSNPQSQRVGDGAISFKGLWQGPPWASQRYDASAPRHLPVDQ